MFRETWFLLLIGGTVLTVVLVFIGMLYLRRRQALSKELGHLNGESNIHNIDSTKRMTVRQKNVISITLCKIHGYFYYYLQSNKN